MSPIHEGSHGQVVLLLLVRLLEVLLHETLDPALGHHDGAALVGDVASLDQDHLEGVEVVLGAVVEVVQLLLEVIEDLRVPRHVRGEDEDDHILHTEVGILGGSSCLAEHSATLTPLTSLNSSSDMLANMLHSGELRILKETAQ